MEASILDSLFNSLSVPLLAVDRNLRVAYSNPAAELFWRIRPGKLIRYELARLFGAHSIVIVHARRALDEELSTTINSYRFDQGPGMPPLILRVQIDPVQRYPQAVEWALLTFWDQTQHEHLENAHREAGAMDSIRLMLGRLAHELQNPLSGIKGATQLLARKTRETSELREYPVVILRELERLERLVGELLGHGEPPPLIISRFNLHELLDTVIWFERNSTNRVDFVRDYDPSLPEMQGDRDRLHQVFLNLIRNAVEASPDGGTVTVRTAMVGPWGNAQNLPEPTGTFFQVEVVDTGPGVSEAHHAKLFTPFFTTKKNGNGLGLSISQQIVRAHNGMLRYHPSAQGGAVFSVSLPRTISLPT